MKGIENVPSSATNLRLLVATGKFLHGRLWQKDMAADLEVRNRTISRWLNETYNVNDVLPNGTRLGGRLLDLLETRRDAIDRLINQIKKTYDL